MGNFPTREVLAQLTDFLQVLEIQLGKSQYLIELKTGVFKECLGLVVGQTDGSQYCNDGLIPLRAGLLHFLHFLEASSPTEGMT